MNLNSFLHFISSLIVIAFSVFVFIKNRKNIYFTIFGTSIFVWLLASSLAYIPQEEAQALFWFKISYLGILFIPPTFYNFVCNLLKQKHSKIVSLSFMICLFFIILLYFSDYLIAGTYQYTWGFYPKASPIAHPLFLLYFVVLFAMSQFKIFLGFWSKTSRLQASERYRLQYVFIGSIIGVIGAFDFLPNYGIDIYPFGFIFMVVFPTILSYAILRYRLLDIYLAIKKNHGLFSFSRASNGFFCCPCSYYN